MGYAGFTECRFIHINCEHSDAVITPTKEGNFEFWGVSFVANEHWEKVLSESKRYQLIANFVGYSFIILAFLMIGALVAEWFRVW
jgi:hypothetical protein